MCRLFPENGEDDDVTYEEDEEHFFMTDEEQWDIELGVHRFGPFYYSHYPDDSVRQVGIEIGRIFSIYMTIFPPQFTVHGSFSAGMDIDFPPPFPYVRASFEFVAFSVNVRFGGR